ncbi:MAG: aryl-alcohol dehydrogenase-like predicted oxidoreductase [Pseudohongiellaceae bacterium]|jgi:aryl-alcohol dehydrogenase-like predicted oxidoreductase
MTLPLRALGSTDIMVSCLGLGTVKFGRNSEVKYPTNFSLPSDVEIERLLAVAHDQGINLLDTAPAYGSSEQRIGRLLKNRDQWIICTKVGEQFVTGKSIYDFSAQSTIASIDKSLRYLNTDYIDIALVHSDGRDQHILDKTSCFEALSRLKEAGKIRAIGMSTKTVAGALNAMALCDVLMVTYNPSAQEDEIVIDAALEKGCGILIKKAFDSGHAVVGGKKASVAKNLEFVLSKPGVSSAIIGTINQSHLADNIAAAREACK